MFSQPKKGPQDFVPRGKDGIPAGSSQANNRDVEHVGHGDSQDLSTAGSSSGKKFGEQNDAANIDFMTRFSGYIRTFFYNQDGAKLTSENQTPRSLAQEESTLNENTWTTPSTSAQSTGRQNENILSEMDFNMYLRVQPELTTYVTKSNETNKSTSLNQNFLQPTTVFVDFESLPPLVFKSWTCNLAKFPPPDGTIAKTVQISRLLSPKERVASRPRSQENPGSKSQDSTNRVSEPSDSASQGEIF